MERLELTPALLDEWENELRGQGAPCAEHFRPGLSDDEIVGATSVLGFTPPQELIVWWRWHDGVADDAGLPRERAVNPRSWQPLSLRRAIGLAQKMREIAEDTDDPEEEPPDELWPPGLLPVVTWSVGGAIIAANGGAEDAPYAPLHYVDWHDTGFTDPMRPVLPALGTLVGLWIEALRSGEHRWDTDSDQWLGRRGVGEIATVLDLIV